MKKFYCFAMTVAMMAVLCVLPSCSKDDDDDDKGASLGWFKAEGKTTHFKYCYLADDELMFTTFDVVDVYVNPSKYKGQKVSAATFDIDGEWFDAYMDLKVSWVDEGEIYGSGGMGYDGEDYKISVKGGTYSISGSNVLADCWQLEEDGDEIDLDRSVKVDFSFSAKPTVPTRSEVTAPSLDGIEYVTLTDPKLIKSIKSLMPSKRTK